MSVPAVYLPVAEDDIAEAHAYYEAQRVGLGDDFAAAVEAAVAGVCAAPQLFAVLRRGIRAGRTLPICGVLPRPHLRRAGGGCAARAA